ncbi:MAG TPA: hypothetical protein VLC46_02115 [Thermoanaerobaculia bacterium]|jgi:hypothetical protein|nr:hypothetical protein [Thermoanaerobaculia bacterium]
MSRCREYPRFLLLALVATSCNSEIGHAVFRDKTIGVLSPVAEAGRFAFTVHGHRTQFTFASSEPIVLPRGSNVHILLTDRSGDVIAGAQLNGETLQSTNWDGAEASVLLNPLPDWDERLRDGQMYQMEVSVTPAKVLAHPLRVVQHWESEHGE